MSAFSPGLSTFTFAPRRLALRPAALRRVGDARAARRRRARARARRRPGLVGEERPRRRRRGPRSAASSGCSATVAGAEPPRDLRVVREAVVQEPRRGRGEQAQAAVLGPRVGDAGAARAGRPSASARPRRSRPGRSASGSARSANWTTGSSADRHRSPGGELVEVERRRRVRSSTRRDDRPRRSRRARARRSPSLAASRRKISWFGSASPSGSHRLDLGREREVEVRGDEVVELEEARRRQHEVGEVGRVGREEVDRDGEQVLAARARRRRRACSRVRRGDVDVPADERPRRASGSSRRAARSMWLTGGGGSAARCGAASGSRRRCRASPAR